MLQEFARLIDEPERLDLSAIREKLRDKHGPEFWRSLEEISETPEFQRFLEQEFPANAVDPEGRRFDRRQFLKLMGAAFALVGLTGCDPIRAEKIVPAVKPVEEVLPGRPLYYATALIRDGFGTGVLVETHEGRPTKIEGNPDHPASLGATDAIAQAEILTLYDPDRSQLIVHRDVYRTFPSFVRELESALAVQETKKGAGLRVLTGATTSPSFRKQMDAVLERFPEAQWVVYEPVGDANRRLGSELLYGWDVHTYYRFDQARVIVSLDADFLTSGPGAVRYARDFAQGRKVRGDQARMNRLYVIESSPTLTGAAADHRLPLRADAIGRFAAALAAAVGVPGVTVQWPELDRWIRAIAEDLNAHSGASIVLAGPNQPPEVHALVHWINYQLGNVGATVVHTEPIEQHGVRYVDDLTQLTEELKAGAVDLLVTIDCNPAFTAPQDLNFAEAMAQAKLSVHMGLYRDETGVRSDWHLPMTHALEAWADVRAYEGTVTIVQPLIRPLYNGISPLELLERLAGNIRTPYDIVRATWEENFFGQDFEFWWRKAVHDGVVPDTAAAPFDVFPIADAASLTAALPPVGEQIEVTFRPDPTIHDGRYANNAWLQETPKPLTLLTWDNAALVSPKLAERLNLQNGDLCEFHFGGGRLQAAVWILPGQPEDSVAFTLGYGRTQAGNVGNGTGFNAYALRSSEGFWFGDGLSVSRMRKRYRLVSTQLHHSMEGRDLVRVGTLEAYRREPSAFPPEHGAEGESALPVELTFYPPAPEAPYAWAMVIDLNACIGCGACITACQAENNIAVVGKEQVAVGREMHWIRIDRYFFGELDNPEVAHQPVPCMHCENAPCEPVCPVHATVHSREGLNQMVYNRCVGTRYCANNCPYKVRRFNFFQYQDKKTEAYKLMRNPDVTVRVRGVMEKCTYCVQRINQARIAALKEDRSVRDGEIQTACQQVCPTGAIVFGNLKDPESEVARLRNEPRHYRLLEELNTNPRTTYLARLRNPNPALAAAPPEDHEA